MASNNSRDRSEDSRPASVLIIAGEGGHLAQATRIVNNITDVSRRDKQIVLLTDHNRAEMKGFDSVFSVPTCAPKDRQPNVVDYLRYLVAAIRILREVASSYQVKLVIVTGPGFAVLPAAVFKIMRCKLVVFESWSRFEHKSKCSKLLYPISDEFWVQHEDLLKLFPKAKWVGLL